MSNLVKVIKLIINPQNVNPEVDVSERPEISGTPKGLWIEPGLLISLINGWVIAVWAVQVGYVLRPRLKPKNGVGAKVTYSDESILLTVIVMRVWRKGYESFSGWLSRNPTLAHSLGYTDYDQGGRLKTISASQLSRRHRQLGYVPYVLFFIALVWQLIRLGAINGRDLIIDSSLLQAWYHHDPDANYSYRSRWKGAVFGYKIHTIVCRHLVLPIFFWVTPASSSDPVWAIPLLATTALVYGFAVRIVRADAAYFSWKILAFIRLFFGASAVVDYNVRRKNKQLVTLDFILSWEGLMAPRSDIERHFAWAKRYFGLKYFQTQGWHNIMAYACCTYIAMAAVAIVAYRCQRPELAGSRTRILAWA